MNDLLDIGDVEVFKAAPMSASAAQLDAAVAIARRCCRWHVAPSRTETLLLDGNGGTVMHLPTLHVTDVASIAVDGVAEPTVDWSTNGGLWRPGGGTWPVGRRNISVTFTHGWDRADVADLVAVVVSVAERMPSVVGSDDVDAGIVEETIGTYHYRLADGHGATVALADSELVMLDPFRIAHPA